MAASASLEEQFQLLQQQQQKRYELRTSVKASRKRNDDCQLFNPESVHEIPSRSRADDLDLGTATRETTASLFERTSGPVATAPGGEDDRYRTRETVYLQQQVETLQLQASTLKADLQRRERELTEEQSAREQERTALLGAGGESSSSAAQRIVDLSKKNRELCAELGKERNRARRLEKRVGELEATIESQASKSSLHHESHSSLTISTTGDHSIGAAPSCAQLQEHLRHAKRKIAEYRNQSQQLKTDLKLLHRVLVKEVGEGVSVTALLSESSGWRGRSQQITALQSKVMELRERLEVQRERAPDKLKSVTTVEAKAGSKADARQKATLRRMESERKRNLEDTQQALDGLRSDHSRLQSQCSALRARNKTLSSEAREMRSQVAAMAEKSTRDDHQLAILTREKSESVASEGSSTEDSHWLNDERQRLERANQTLQKQLAKSVAEIQALRGANRQLQPTSSNQTKRALSSYTELQSHVQPSEEQYHEPKLTLPPIIQTEPASHDHRTVRKSLSAGQTSVLLCTDSQDNRHDLMQAEALKRVAQIEQSRLVLLISSLQQRLDATTDSMIRIETESRNHRSRCGKLERQLGRTRDGGPAGKRKPEQGGSKREDEVALLRDEAEVLKETLELTRHERSEDLRLFQSMLQEAKQLFVESVRKLQSGGGV